MLATCVKCGIANKMSLSSLKSDCTILLFIHFKRATSNPRAVGLTCPNEPRHAVPDTLRYIMQTFLRKLHVIIVVTSVDTDLHIDIVRFRAS
jgi:hypothetical protein